MTAPYGTSASLYVGDLHPDVTEALLFEIFREVGPVVSTRVCRDTITRRSLGYAYVNFQDPNDAERALDSLNYTLVKEKPIRIMWSHRDPSIRKSGVGNIFIKNLDKSIDNKALYDTFSAFGNILSCKVATDEKNQSKGYGFVHYETQEAAEQSIAKVNGMLLNDKKVYVGPFIRRSEREKGGESEKKFTNVFIKNLDESVTEEQLKQLFSPFGAITRAALMQDEESSKFKGFGFVNYENPESAKRAVEAMHNTTVEGKQIWVGRAQKKAERSSELRQKFEQLKIERMSKYQGVNLYVKNLDDTVDDEMLRQEFSQFGSITSAKVMRDDKTNVSRGFGFVCFTTPEEATKALGEMNGRMFGSKPIYCALAQRKEIRRAHLEAQHAQRTGIPLRQSLPPPMYPPGPVFYQPGMPPAQRTGYVTGFPPQMQMQRRGPWPGQGANGNPTFYPIAPNGPYVMPVMPGQRGRGARGGPGRNPNMTGGNVKPQNFKYNRGVRNQIPQQMRQGMPPQQNMNEPLSASVLASATEEEQNQILGQRLFPLIHSMEPDYAAKITGMLLEIEKGELIHLLESPESLREKVNEAMGVLTQSINNEQQ